MSSCCLRRTNGAPDSGGGGAAANDIIVPLCFDASTLLVFLGFVGGGTFSSLVTCNPQYLVSDDLTLVEVVLDSITTDYGSTIVGSHLDANVTPIDTDTQALDVASGAVTFTLGTAYNAGDRISVSFDGLLNGGNVTGYMRLRL